MQPGMARAATRALASARPRSLQSVRDLTHYELLGVSSDASAEEISRAFRRRARALHPDLQRRSDHGHATGSASEIWEWEESRGEVFQRLVDARRVLGSPVSRRAYDAHLRRGDGAGGPGGIGGRYARRHGDNRAPGEASAGPGSAHRAPPHRGRAFGPAGVYRRPRGPVQFTEHTEGFEEHPWRWGLDGLDRWAARRRERAEGAQEATLLDWARGWRAEKGAGVEGPRSPARAVRWNDVGFVKDARDVGVIGALLPDALVAALWGAMRHAYLGPDISHLKAGELPDGFEAESRTSPTAGDLWQLVSGRTTLGAVREASLPGCVGDARDVRSKRDNASNMRDTRECLELELAGRVVAHAVRRRLGEAEGAAWHAGGELTWGARELPSGGVERESGDVRGGAEGGEGVGRGEGVRGVAEGSEGLGRGEDVRGGAEGGGGRVKGEGGDESRQRHGWLGRVLSALDAWAAPFVGVDNMPLHVCDVFWGTPSNPGPLIARVTGSEVCLAKGGVGESGGGGGEGGGSEGAGAGAGESGSASASARHLRRTHSVLFSTLRVRGRALVCGHTWVAHAEGRRAPVLCCRVQHARAVNARYWLFSPRTLSHQGGSWHFEAGSLTRCPPPLQLPTAVPVLVAAFAARDAERARGG